MSLLSFRCRRILRTSIATALGCGFLGAVGTMGWSALLKWDPSGAPATLGGTGTWDYTSTLWDDDGALPNVTWSDVSGLDTAFFSGTGALVHLGAPITANGLTFNVTGYTVDNNGSALNTLSLTNSTIGPAPAITTGAANVTSIISASLLGNAGLQFTAGALTGTTTKLSGDNKFIGGVTITSGTVSVENAGGLNQSIRNTLSFGTSATIASALRLNGNSIAVRDLFGPTNTSSITNGVAGNAILTVYQQNNQVVNTVLANGTAGTLELVKDGPGTLILGSDNTYSGATTVRGSIVGGPIVGALQGTLQLAGSNVGRLTATTSVNLSDDGMLRLLNSSTANQADRLPDAVPINLRGGTLAFSNDGSTAAYAETAGVVNVLAGTNNIFADQAATGQTSALTFTSLARSPGAVVAFQSQSQGSTVPMLIGADTRDRIVFSTPPALNDTLIGGWALYDTRDFATYNTTTFASVKMATYMLDLDQTLWTTATNVKVDSAVSTVTLTANRTVNSLNLAADPLTLDISGTLSGLILNIDTGGLIDQTASPFGGTIQNGLLTAGTAAGAELFLTVPIAGGRLTLTNTASIVDNGANSVGLVKAGAGTLILSGPNTYTGPTSILGGAIQIDNDSYLGGGTAATTLKLYDGTLSVTTSLTLNARRSIEVGGNSYISVAAGTTGQGRVFTFSGTINSLAGTEGNLTFLSNATEDSLSADPGKINVQLTGALTLGGSLRIESTSASGLFRPNAAFSNTIGRSLQVGMNGSATFLQSGGTLSVGAGVDDTLDIGVKDEVTASSVAKIGTLTLTGVTQFTAKVDRVRIGVQTQSGESVANSASGTVTLATANDLSAGTDITISDNANASGSTLAASTLTFGTGTNNVTTQTFTIGGRKGNATVSLPAGGGTLNLKGFAERTLDLSIGRSDLSDTSVVSTGTLSTANGTLTGSFDAVVIGQKTGSAVAGGANGTFTLGAAAGNLVVANSVALGVDTGYTGSASPAATAVGTLNLAGGAFYVYNDVTLGTQANNGTARSALNITGGTFNVGGNITKTNSDRSNGVVTVNGATAVLNLRNPLAGDTTSGNITASELIFRQGSITNTALITLDGRDVTSGSVFGPLTDALIVRDVNLAAPVNLTGATANMGGVHYEAAGNGVGATLASVSLGTVGRTFNVENSTTAADLTVSGAVTGAVPLTKTGTGTVLLNGAVAGSASVVAGALGGTGNIAGTVNVGSAGTLTPAGSGSIGTFATGALTFAASASMADDINFFAHTSDKVTVTGNFSLDGSNTTVLSLTDLNPIGPFSFFALPIVDYSGSWNLGLFTVGGVVITDYDAANPDASTKFLVNGNQYALDYNFNSGHTVALITIPEPGSIGLLFGGLGVLGSLRRSRRRP